MTALFSIGTAFDITDNGTVPTDPHDGWLSVSLALVPSRSFLASMSKWRRCARRTVWRSVQARIGTFGCRRGSVYSYIKEIQCQIPRTFHIDP